MGYGDGPEVQNNGFSPREHKFDSYHPGGDSQSSWTPVPGTLIPSFGLHRHRACMWYIDMQVRQTTHKHKLIT